MPTKAELRAMTRMKSGQFAMDSYPRYQRVMAKRIQRICNEIQSTWTLAERYKRAGMSEPDYRTQAYTTHRQGRSLGKSLYSAVDAATMEVETRHERSSD